MSKVILICGLICSGKTYYAHQLCASGNTVLFSTDEATFDLIDNKQDEFYDAFAARVNKYLRKKAVETVRAGVDVILDWGFWSRAERREMTRFLKSSKVEFEWHYIDIPLDIWQKRIEERNARIAAGKGGYDFYLDEGLMKKLVSRFEAPLEKEIDIWVMI